jgi:hypothetical protein
MRNASAKGLEMKTPFNNNLPTQTGDVIINPGNPVNPDSNTQETVILYNLTFTFKPTMSIQF